MARKNQNEKDPQYQPDDQHETSINEQLLPVVAPEESFTHLLNSSDGNDELLNERREQTTSLSSLFEHGEKYHAGW